MSDVEGMKKLKSAKRYHFVVPIDQSVETISKRCQRSRDRGEGRREHKPRGGVDHHADDDGKRKIDVKVGDDLGKTSSRIQLADDK